MARRPALVRRAPEVAASEAPTHRGPQVQHAWSNISRMAKRPLRPLSEVLPKWLRDPAFREGFQAGYISVVEAASRLNVSEAFIVRKSQEGAFPVVAQGIPLEQFDRFAAEMRASQDAALSELLNLERKP